MDIRRLYKKKTIRILAVVILLAMAAAFWQTMAASAASGTLKGTAKSQQRAAIYYTYTQNKDTLKTTLTVRLRVYATGSTYSTHKADAKWSLTYNGTTKTGTKDYTMASSGSYKNISSTYTTTIQQTDGASKKINVSGWLDLSGTTVGGKLSVSDSITLPAMTATTTSKAVKLVWKDNNDQDGIRPASVKVTLYRNGSSLKSANVSGSYTFTGIRKYDNSGDLYTYTVKATAPTGYTASVSGGTITLTHTPYTTSHTGTVSWADDNDRDGIRPPSVSVQLYKDGTLYKTGTATEAGGWAVSFNGLPKNASGKAISWTSKIAAPDGYTASGLTASHTPERKNVEGAITWVDENNKNGYRPQTVAIKLIKDGEELASTTTSAARSWKYSFPDQYVYENGSEVRYEVTGADVDAYDHTVTGTNLTYTYFPGYGINFGFSI
ncbi:Cna B-type domain-containing protein [bacterium 210820-DFI.6.37]|nr:Cna B-type domain-containing protein [bacterium 210820-DFI.6.37]